MTNQMRISRRIATGGAIVTIKDIIELAKIVLTESEKDNDVSDGSKYFRLILRDADGINYENKNPSITFIEDYLINKRIVHFELHYTTYFKKGKNIDMYITQTPYHLHYQDKNIIIYVEGDDELWVNGIFNSIDQIISKLKKQTTWPIRHYYVYSIIFLAGIFILTISILREITIPTQISGNEDLKHTLSTTIAIAEVGFGLYIFDYIFNKIKSYYPYIELETGPQHLRKEQEGRNKLFLLVVAILLPFVISLFITIIF